MGTKRRVFRGRFAGDGETKLRYGSGALLVALSTAIGGVSTRHLIAPVEPLVGRVLGLLTFVGLAMPLFASGVWIWTSQRDDGYRDLLRILRWCVAGLIPPTLFATLFILYERQHGVVIAEPVAVLLWIAGGGAVGGLVTGLHDARRQRAYRRQQRYADRLLNVVDTAPVPIIERGPDGTVRQWNDAAERVFGWSADDVVGESLPFDADAGSGADKNETGQREQVRNVEVKCRTRDGEVRDFLRSRASLPDESERDQSSSIDVFVDVSQQKRQRNQLELFRALLDHSNDGIFVIDAEAGGFVDVNETACQYLGYDRERLLDSSVMDVETTLSTKAAWDDHVEQVRDEGSVLYEGRHRRTDGSIVPVEVNVAHVELDAEYVVAIARDVTERKERERELRQFQRAVEHSGYAIYITDRDGTIEYVNPAFEDLTGYSSDEVVGDDPRVLQSGEHGEQYYRRLWNTILDGRIWEEEIVNQRKSGERYTAHQTIAPIFDDGDIVGFVAVQNDITSQHVREQRISVLNRVLRHNLRNEVNVISGHAELLLLDLEDPDRRAYAEKIYERARALESLSEKAQTLAKILDARPLEQPVFVSDVLVDVAASFESQYSAAEITVDNAVPDDARVAHGVEPILEELLENAIEHNDRPTPCVTVSGRMEHDTGHVSIAVTDNGPEIPGLDSRTISQGSPEEPLQHGSGIGLWLVKWVTTALGGAIELTENSPTGSTVTLTLPRLSDATDPSTGGTPDAQNYDVDIPRSHD